MASRCCSICRLTFTSFCELAQLYITSSKLARPPPQAKPRASIIDSPAPAPAPGPLPRSLKSPAPTCTSSSDQEQSLPMPSSSRRSSRSGMSSKPSSQEQDKSSKAEREWLKERGRESYLAWCMVRSALHSCSTSQQLQVLASELHNEEISRHLTDKMLDDLPDFVLLDLCPSENFLQALATDVRSPPIEMMLPSTQYADTTGLTWFKIIGYFYKLLQTCFWQKAALNATRSPWMLHYGEQTPSTYSKCKALLNFLLQHCPPFKSCKLPSLPPLLSLSAAQRQSGGSSGVQSAVVQQADAYLSAADNELTVLWMKPFLSLRPDSRELDDLDDVVKDKEIKEADSDSIVGYFALNQKSVRTSVPPNLSSFGFESHIVRISVRQLSELHTLWKDLATTSKIVLAESRASSRPMSRSPSKQKKIEKPSQVPAELVECLEKAVINLAEAFGSKLSKEQIPKLELQSVATVAKILEPFTHATIKGDAYCFIKSLFNSQ